MSHNPDLSASASGWFDTLDSRVLHEGIFCRVRVDRIRLPDGHVAEREVVEQDDAVGVVPLDEDGAVVLLRQYRHTFGTYQLEIPAGKLDVAGEDITEAARRELAEEAGLKAEELEHLLSFRNSAGWTDEVTHLYRAGGLAEVPPPPGFTPHAEEADMEVVRLPLEEAVAEVRAGVVVDAKTVIGLLLANTP